MLSCRKRNKHIHDFYQVLNDYTYTPVAFM